MIEFDCQIACECSDLPSQQHFKQWFIATLPATCQQASVCIRIIDEQESAELNLCYRKKSGPTNVLAFSYECEPLAGDLAICAPIVIREAQQAGISSESHWAHMVVHGTLHLLGYDHEKNQQAEEMESQESKIMVHLGYKDLYL
ncbi:MAG: rRNA maturation RNase YbeY [Gammaproteobacteria bacterium]|nr:rRNA maturation RNase YbeY [Gammaproteobacteria bacterium]